MREIDLKEIFEQGKDENIRAYLNFLNPLEVVDAFYLIDENEYSNIVSRLSYRTFANSFPFFERSLFEKVIVHLKDEDLVNIFNKMESDDVSHLLRTMDEQRQQVIIPKLAHSLQIQEILSHPEESAGSIMQTEVCIIHPHISVKQAIELIRKQKKILGEVQVAYVVDENKILLGLVRLDDLILSNFDESIDLVTKELKYHVNPDMDQEEVALIFSKYDLSYLPVIDISGRLLGQITYDDIQDVIEEEASEDLLAYVGVSPDESISDTDENRIKLALGRFPWLVFSISASMLTGYILTFFEAQTSNAIIFASFVPLIMNTTGNVGTQTAMIITRNFALGANEFGQFRLPLMREFLVGLTLGLLAGVLTLILIFLAYQNIAVGIRVGITLTVSMTVAALFGMFIPVTFKKIGIDPAIASGPLVTSGCDMLSVSLYLLIIISLNKGLSIFGG
jgi:magnesium transporter